MNNDAVLDRYIAAVADPARRRAIEALSTGARRAGELAALAGVAPAAMSRHLRLLLAAGVVDDERSVVDARVRLFFLQREPIARIGEWAEGVLAGHPPASTSQG